MINIIHNNDHKNLLAPILWLALAGVSFYWVIFFGFWGIGIGQNLFNPTQVQAQVNPISEQNQVTATMPDIVAPSTPILIAPANNALLNTATPNFVWQGSTDNVAVSHYTIYLDGEIWLDNIPLSDTDNNNYTLTYNSSNSYYTLEPQNLLSNGTFTWKVVAEDTSGNTADSATWSFSIDTHSPSFVIEQIGTEEVSISAKDPDTQPEDPIILTENEPLLLGTGEGGSIVDVTITTPDDTDSDSFTIDGDGDWDLQLGILPRGVTIYLDFIITDEAGNVSVLLDVPIEIKEEEIVIPPTTPPESPISTATPTGTPAPTSTPPIVIPKLSAREWRQEILKTAEGYLPLSLKEISGERLIKVQEKPEPARNLLLEFAGFAAVALPPLIAFLILLTIFGKKLPLSSLPYLAGLAGLIPSKPKYNGVVFEGSSGNIVSFAQVLFSGITEAGERIYAQVLTNYHGFYVAPNVPPGNYVCSVVHPSFSFPTRIPREQHLAIHDFYCGEKIVVSENQVEHQLAIPVDQETKKQPFHYSLLARLQYRGILSYCCFAASVMIMILVPSFWNVLGVALYIAIGLVKLLHESFQPEGLVINQQGKPLNMAILRLENTTTGQTISISRSNQKGAFSYHKFTELPADTDIQFRLTKYGWQKSLVEDLDIVVASPTSAS